MRVFKKLSAALFCACLVCALFTACSDDDDDNDGPKFFDPSPRGMTIARTTYYVKDDDDQFDARDFVKITLDEKEKAFGGWNNETHEPNNHVAVLLCHFGKIGNEDWWNIIQTENADNLYDIYSEQNSESKIAEEERLLFVEMPDRDNEEIEYKIEVKASTPSEHARYEMAHDEWQRAFNQKCYEGYDDWVEEKKKTDPDYEKEWWYDHAYLDECWNKYEKEVGKEPMENCLFSAMSKSFTMRVKGSAESDVFPD